jgi:hypothetical protein
LRVRRPRLTYSGVVATLALFLALGGGVYAATQLPKNSVGRKQLRKNAVVGSKVKDGSLGAADFRSGALPRGPQGPTGEAGATGARGPAGQPGPGATKLFADLGIGQGPETLGTVGPWTFSLLCVDNESGASPVTSVLRVDGPGTADLSATAIATGPPNVSIKHFHLASDDEVVSLGGTAPTLVRSVGTVVLSAGRSAPVVTASFATLADESGKRCSIVGSAVPAG